VFVLALAPSFGAGGSEKGQAGSERRENEMAPAHESVGDGIETRGVHGKILAQDEGTTVGAAPV
jgi:hypothetical protein